MEDRIQINGVWYVRETDTEEEIRVDNLTQTLNIIYENGDYVWEATRIYNDDGESFYDGFDIEFTDKTTKPWKTEQWDNMTWFKGILDNNHSSMEDAKEDMNDKGIKDFRLFLNELKNRGWF